MSQDERQAKQERSSKLCQLIYDRQIVSEIGYEIRKLLEEGVFIDFKDQDRSKKTALHLAVEKCDINCVKFLLQFKPRLEVKDEDGRTPLELAVLNGFDDILNVLLESSVDFVDKSYVEVFDYESLTRQKIEAIKSRPTFKVLKLTNCPSVNEVWVKLDDHAYATAFSESSHLFFIAIETNDANIENDLELMKKVLDLRRPMIVQLTSSDSPNTIIYFKDDENSDFEEITDTMQITQEEFNEAVEYYDECNMKLLVAALRSNLFGSFTGDLLLTKLNANGSRSEAVNQFARSNPLCHRFFKLFDESQPQIDTIVAALSFKGESLMALLELPFELKEQKLKLTEYQQDILSVVDDRNYNLLMMAAEQNNLDAIKLLLRCGCDFNHIANDGYRTSDICWEVDDFDHLAELIETGSPFPYHFSFDELDESLEISKRIDTMIEAVNSFHANIEEGKIEEVKKFISGHPHIKHAYDTNNKCALTVALQSDKVEIHSLLMSEGFEPGVDDEYHDALDASKFKYEIRDSHRKYFKKAFDEPHLKRLLNKYRLSFGSKDRARCSTIIRKMFDELNEIDELIPILKICSTSDKLKIVFDFNCKYVVDMDPISNSRALGAVYPIGGFVYIGAKNEFYKVIGALIHELTHFAMKLTYENSCKPYDEGDNEKLEQFGKVAMATKKICDENPSADRIVTTVFSKYEESVWHQELIVRAPQLLAHYKINRKALEAAERITSELFHFYREKTLKDVAVKSEILLQKYLISKINKQTGIAQRIKNLNVKFKNAEIGLNSSVNVITSNAPQLTLAMFHQIYPMGSHIFVTLEQIAIGNVLDKIAKITAKEISTTLIVDCIGQTQKYPESLQKLLKKIKNIKYIALVMAETEGTKVKENKSKVEFKAYTHKWAELTEKTKVNLLNRNVIFLGIECDLTELVEPSSKAMNFFPLGDILDCKEFKIGHELNQTSHKFYIERKFKRKEETNSISCTPKSFEELINDDPTMRVMIVSDEAGSGKSVTLFEIAKSLHEKYPNRWILFVDLKCHIEAFKFIENCEQIKTFEDFISDLILRDETEFDRELFKQMFRDGKTFVLLDGFDEISPNFETLLRHVLRLFQPGPGNQLYITTRPHLEEELEAALGKFVFKLETFSREMQKSFLREYWVKVSFESEEDFEVLSERLLEKFSDILESKFIGLPLLMRMTAEIFSDRTKENSLDKLESLNVASVFKEFVDKYLTRWKEARNEISLRENVEIDRDGGILEIHHSIAIKHKFGDKFSVFEVDESDAEKIARVGLIRYDKAKKTFQFIHETFAEYFVADFICFYLKRKNRNPSHDCRTPIEIFIELVKIYDLEVVKTFLDQTLETAKLNLNEASCKSLGKCVSEVVASQKRFDILRNSMNRVNRVNRLNDNILILLLSLVKYADKSVLLKMMESRDKHENATALNVAAFRRSSKVVAALCNVIATRIDSPKIIFKQKSQGFDNILFSAAENEKKGVLAALCEGLLASFSKEEITIMFQEKDMKGYNIIRFAANGRSDEVFNELISLLHNYLSADELKGLLLASDGLNQNCFQRALVECTKKNIKRQIVFARSLFDTKEDQRAFFRQLGLSGRNIFHYAAENRNKEIFPTIIEATCDVLSSDDFKAMLMGKDSEGSNVLHVVTKCDNLSSLHELNSLLRELLSDDDIRSLLLKVNEKGENCFRLASYNNRIDSQVFREVIGNLLPQEDQTRLLQETFMKINIFRLAAGNYTGEDVPVETIRYLLMEKDDEGHNAFQIAVLQHRGWDELVAFAQARFSVEELRTFLLDYETEGESCLHLALDRSDKYLFKDICETFRRVLSVEEQKEIVQQKFSDNRNVFHRAAKIFHGIKIAIEYLSAILSHHEIKVMLEHKDSDGRHILFYYLGDSVTLNILTAFLTKILSNDEIKKLLFDEDREGQTCFHYCVGSKLASEIKSLSDFIKTILNRDDQRRFFGMKNLFYLPIENGCPEIFSTIHDCLKGVFTDIEIKSMIREKDSGGNNILLLLCQKDSSLLLDFFKVLKEVLGADELKDFLRSSSHCLLLAAKFQSGYYLENLIEFIQAQLSIDDLQDMIRKHDSDGNNIFICATQKKHSGNVLTVKDLAKEILSADQIREMLLHGTKFNCFQCTVMAYHSTKIKSLGDFIKTILNQDEQRNYFGMKNHNLFRLAIENQNNEIFSTIHECLKGVFTCIEIKSMIREKDSDGNNILLSICQENKNAFMLADFFKVLKDIFETNELKIFFTLSNNHGSNFLLLAFEFISEYFLEKLIKFIQTELSVDDLQDMIQKHDNAGNNIFKCAARNRDHKIFSLVKFFAKEILSDAQFTMLYHEFPVDKNEDGAEASNFTLNDEF